MILMIGCSTTRLIAIGSDMAYKLNIKRDVDISSDGYNTDYVLNLPKGFRFYNEIVHTRGYDSMKELKDAAKNDVVPCNCKDCIKK